MKIILKNGLWLNKNGLLEHIEVKMDNSYITEIGENLYDADAQIIDLKGNFISPGFIDLHVHLREPGGEQKETIATGTLAAAKGGFTTIAAMPNTKPVIDSKEKLEWLTNKILVTSYVDVLPYAAITTNESGQELTNFAELKSAGAFAFTDDGYGVQSAEMMLQAMKNAAEMNMAIVAHCEENTLINHGVVHEGKFSRQYGLKGIPSICESVQIARDVLLAESAGCHYHVCHISTKESVRVVRDAKKAGINVTAEVTPHHLLLSEDDIQGPNSNFKMNPPLRSKEDRQALLSGLLDGIIDFIATDHAPHTKEEKAAGIERAPFGIVGLETAFPLLYTNFVVHQGVFTLQNLVDFLTKKPANAFDLPYEGLKVGAKASLTVIDLNHEEKINPESFVSKGKNTPFADWNCKGWPVATFVNGKLVWQKERIAK